MTSSPNRVLRMAAVALALVACNSDRVMGPGAAISVPGGTMHALLAAPPTIRISEVHYDNAGTDAGERIEVSGPAGASIEGYTIVLYNGNGGAVYTPTRTLRGTLPATCGARGVVFETYSVNGIQNGDPDGIALVNASGVLVEFLSYGGSFTGVGGAAGGVLSTPMLTAAGIPVKELSTTPVGHSLQRLGDGSWQAPAASTFGICNDNGPAVVAGPLASIAITPASANIVVGSSQAFTAKGSDAAGNEVTGATFTWSTPNPELITVNATTGAVTGIVIGDTKLIATSGSITAEAIVHVVAPAPPPANLPPTRFTEIHYDNSGDDTNEALEIEGPAGVNVSGWSIALYNGSASSSTGAPAGSLYGTTPLTGVFTSSCNGRGVLVFNYPKDGLQNAGGISGPASDGFALVNAQGAVVEFLSYEGVVTAVDGPAAGMTSQDIGVEEASSASSAQSLQRNLEGNWDRPLPSTFATANACASGPGGAASISIAANGPDTLVVGWQRRAFVTYRDANGTTVSPTPSVTWTSDTPDLASVDSRGYATALKAGTAIVRATIGTTTRTYSIAVIDYEPLRAQYRSHVEFGVPTGADPANNVLLEKPAFITSYNPSRGGPNWVSWNINATTFGDAERCECFSGDLALPAAQRILDSDYVSGGYDRGHMVQSESRTSTHSENAASFLLTNILPQAANNNQGPWLGFENFLNDRARIDGKQVYVVSGGEYAATPTTLKGEGRVAIPDYTWKVAIVVNTGAGLADVRGLSDLTVYAVRIPNLLATAPVKNNVYQPFLTTIDDIEQRTGYDFFTALPDYIETIAESGDRRPTASFTGISNGSEGQTLEFDASGSTDLDVGGPLGDVLSFQWSVDGQVRGTMPRLTATFVDDGAFSLQLIVSDRFGWADTTTKSVTIANVAPTVGSFDGGSIIRGERYAASGVFTDPGADSWTGTVNYGDGSGAQPLLLAGKAFSLAHTYETAGTFIVTVTVRDDELGSGTRSATVVVASAGEAIASLSERVITLASAGTLSRGEANALDASLRNALKSLDKDNPTPARNQLEAFVNKVDAMQRSGRLDAASSAALTSYAQRIIASIV